MLQDIINSTTQVTEGLAQGMGIDVKGIIIKLVRCKDSIKYTRGSTKI